MSFKSNLLKAIENRAAKIGIIGMGYVGLPLAVEFAEAGFQITAVDVDNTKINMLNRGESYIEDVTTEKLKNLVEKGQLSGTTNYADLQDIDAISICVPTPLSKTGDPDMSYINQALDSLATVVHEGMLVVLESTTYPGTTEEVVRPKLEKDSLIVGENLFIAFSGERIDPGNKVYKVKNTPKVVGGISEACTEITSALYQTAVDTIVPVSSPTTAEMVKLLENTFRAVNIAFANEMAIMCDKLGIDVREAIDAASTKPFGFMPFYPGPGPGGHCIPIDPYYLSWKLKTLNYNARFIELAGDINRSMPGYVVDKVADALNQQSRSVRGSRIVVLGVAYKPDVNDVRESPALDVIKLLRQKGADVVYHDPYVPEIRVGDNQMMESCEYSAEFLQSAHCVVIVTNHSNYDWQRVLDNSQMIVDTRNVLSKFESDTPVMTL